MPRYEYACDACGKQFEVTHKMSDPDVTDCESCRAKGTVHRLISAGSGVIFKGSGFYSTDYKTGGAKTGASSTTDAPAAASTDAGSKSDSAAAPAAKPATGGHTCGSGCCHG